jgi:hypothetical protein
VLLAALVMCCTAMAQGNGSAARSWCNSSTEALHTIYQWIEAHKGQKPDVPTPPPTIPDCAECGVENHHTPNQDKIDAYIKKLGQPEMDFVNQLLEIAHTMAVTFGDPPRTTLVPQDLAPCAYYLQPDKITASVRFLMDRVLLDKVIASCDKYKGIKEDIPALEQLVPYYCQTYAYIVGYTQGNAGGIGGYHSLDDQRYNNLQEAGSRYADMVKAYYDYFITGLYDKYQYSLYPNLMFIARQYLLSGYHDDRLENDIYGYINRGIAFMHFRLKIEFEETGPTYHYSLKGEKMIRCKMLPDTTSTCYSFEDEDGRGIPMQLEDVSFTIPNVAADYTGPKQANNAFIIRMKLCDGQPVFHLVFTTFGLKGTMVLHTQAGDVTTLAPFHPEGYFMPDLATAEKRKDQQEKLGDDFKANMDKYKAAMIEWASHRGDPNFANTAAGKKDMALIMQFQHQTGVQTPFLNGVQGQAAATHASVTDNNKLFTFDMPLHFSKQALEYEHTAGTGDKVSWQVKVKLEETPDNRDNLPVPH